MLDELLEYKEYTDKKILEEVLDFNSKESLSANRKQIRLKYVNINNGFSGIKRAMNIIAKYFLNKYDQDEEVAINALKAWAGDEYDNKGIKEIDEIKGYIRPELFGFYKENEERTINNKDKLANIEKLKGKYNNKLKSFDEDILNKESKASKVGISDFNKVTYKSIVHNMKNRPLKRNVLVCKEDILNKVLREDEPLTPKEKDYLLKIISAYLINVKKNQDKVSIVMVDIYNWVLLNHKDCLLHEYCFSDGICPIKQDNNETNIKISIDNSIKDNYRIVDINNIDSITYGETVFIDNGIKDVLSKYYIESSVDLENLIKEID